MSAQPNSVDALDPSLNASSSTPALASRAMLVSLHIAAWGNRKFDRVISADVEKQHEISEGWGAYNKRLIAKEAMREIGGAIAQARTAHYENSLPWLDSGRRILPSANYFAYIKVQREAKERFEKAVAALVADWDKFVGEARGRLGKAFREQDYPSVAKLKAKFSMELHFEPLPVAPDFRVDLGEAEVAKIRENIETRTREAFQGAVNDLWTRIHDGVATVRDRLAAYTVDPETGAVTHPFRNAVFLNLRELVALLPRLNVTGDPKLFEMGERLAETLVKVDPETLRADPRQRESTIQTADDILAAMAGYVS